ncbi:MULTISPECIES: hypothetical protein [Paenisporosarcina]|jgi:hypothetical protein|uniref:Abortive phage infection protein n=1 Tax=Paenisporosarcina quisquiliarum TaxID=365346 RepID=A0A9X3LEJ2_9BACL|nr:hypothetical protein [Paenisporosarcina quisquiliarum]MCZ8536501.1 hypothetical protein [Paenisporosarcina quisquiliarum]
MNTYEQQLEELRTGKLTSITIEKDDFLAFREVLVKREDFKHIRGTAKQGGIVIYTYDLEARS